MRAFVFLYLVVLGALGMHMLWFQSVSTSSSHRLTYLHGVTQEQAEGLGKVLEDSGILAGTQAGDVQVDSDGDGIVLRLPMASVNSPALRFFTS